MKKFLCFCIVHTIWCIFFFSKVKSFQLHMWSQSFFHHYTMHWQCSFFRFCKLVGGRECCLMPLFTISHTFSMGLRSWLWGVQERCWKSDWCSANQFWTLLIQWICPLGSICHHQNKNVTLQDVLDQPVYLGIAWLFFALKEHQSTTSLSAKHSPCHDTPSTPLYSASQTRWIHGLMGFLPNSTSSISAK